MPFGTDGDFLENLCLPFLRSTQNADGGWGFHPGAPSRVEPTAWALLAFEGLAFSRRSAVDFLRKTQLADGSWPSAGSVTAGSWVSSLAVWALAKDADSRAAVAAGLVWLCQDWPRDVGIASRLIRSIVPSRRATGHDESLHGWGWTPRTASWVEPTAFALIALDAAPADLLPSSAQRRKKLARALLYDRMCPGGGWNCGNPAVYGVNGEPLIEPTGWSLLALRKEPERSENLISFEWLQRQIVKSCGPGSLAVAKICFDACALPWPGDAPNLRELHERNGFLLNVPVMAWASMALCSRKTER
jgi:Prenyltransferase and squalene oxidase repeat